MGSNMEEWQKRLLDENIELSNKIIKLFKIINNYANGSLNFNPNCSIELLTMQLNAMMNYQNILRVRIEIEIPREE